MDSCCPEYVRTSLLASAFYIRNEQAFRPVVTRNTTTHANARARATLPYYRRFVTQGRLRETTDKKAGAMKQAAARALEPQLAELVKSNRVEARAHAEDLETALLGLQATLERESTEQVRNQGGKTYHPYLRYILFRAAESIHTTRASSTAV